ncbi:MAG: hypothetical protein LAO55_12485 [Acidobacteriia bacterium]|nr:hypothetical protein [Terriglobia bacterium]
MAATASTRKSRDEVFSIDIAESYGAAPHVLRIDAIQYWNESTAAGADGIIKQLQDLRNNQERFDEDEPRPADGAFDAIRDILRGAEGKHAKLPRAEVSAFYGELAVTWRIENRTLRLVSYSDGRQPLLYFHTDTAEALSRGETICPATADILKERISWLGGELAFMAS